ncbi:hypothetical protein AUC31_13965 [Planococcus rifietoensis]|uniref:Uncharacterized protein n=1 Tax=Planococcus rifietoensis TaxID=200991 RepID=A0A0U2QAT4_9BACL|nr:hypothetical protein AUC31_13965 [Planococcus rifietoensis]
MANGVKKLISEKAAGRQRSQLFQYAGRQQGRVEYQLLEIIFRQGYRFLLTECSFTFKLEHSIDILPQFT